VIRRHPFDALILQSTFTSLPALTRFLFPRLPLHLLSGNLFDTLSVIRQLQVPLLVMHGTEDEVCPGSMAQQLHDAAAVAKQLHLVEGGMHKDLFLLDPGALIWTISQFVAGLPRKAHRTFSVEQAPALEQWVNSALRSLRRMVRRKGSVIASAAAVRGS
jgi:fermentation-respiration switch protein FrsA (DUF1100 family)